MIDSANGKLVQVMRSKQDNYATSSNYRGTYFINDFTFAAAMSIQSSGKWEFLTIHIPTQQVTSHIVADYGMAVNTDWSTGDQILIQGVFNEQQTYPNQIYYPSISIYDLSQRKVNLHLQANFTLPADFDPLTQMNFAQTGDQTWMCYALDRFTVMSINSLDDPSNRVVKAYSADVLIDTSPRPKSHCIAAMNSEEAVFLESHFDRDVYVSQFVQFVFSAQGVPTNVMVKPLRIVSSLPKAAIFSSLDSGLYFGSGKSFKFAQGNPKTFTNDVAFVLTIGQSASCFQQHDDQFTFASMIVDLSFGLNTKLSTFQQSQIEQPTGHTLYSPPYQWDSAFIQTVNSNPSTVGTPCSANMLPHITCIDCAGGFGDILYKPSPSVSYSNSDFSLALTFQDGSSCSDYFYIDYETKKVIATNLAKESEYYYSLLLTATAPDGKKGYSSFTMSTNQLEQSCSDHKIQFAVLSYIVSDSPLTFDLSRLNFVTQDLTPVPSEQLTYYCLTCDQKARVDGKQFTYYTKHDQDTGQDDYYIIQICIGQSQQCGYYIVALANSPAYILNYKDQRIEIVYQLLSSSMLVIPNARYQTIPTNGIVGQDLYNLDSSPVANFIYYNTNDQSLVVTAKNRDINSVQTTFAKTVVTSYLTNTYGNDVLLPNIFYTITLLPASVQRSSVVFLPSSNVTYQTSNPAMIINLASYSTAPVDAEVTYFIQVVPACPSDCVKYDATSHSISIQSNSNQDVGDYIVTLKAYLTRDTDAAAQPAEMVVQIYPNTINLPFNPLGQRTAGYIIHDPKLVFNITEQKSQPNLPLTYALSFSKDEGAFQTIAGSTLFTFVNGDIPNKRQVMIKSSTFGDQGVYMLKLTVFSNDGTYLEDFLSVTVMYPTLLPPKSSPIFNYYVFSGFQSLSITQFKTNSRRTETPITHSLVSISKGALLLTQPIDYVQWEKTANNIQQSLIGVNCSQQLQADSYYVTIKGSFNDGGPGLLFTVHVRILQSFVEIPLNQFSTFNLAIKVYDAPQKVTFKKFIVTPTNAPVDYDFIISQDGGQTFTPLQSSGYSVTLQTTSSGYYALIGSTNRADIRTNGYLVRAILTMPDGTTYTSATLYIDLQAALITPPVSKPELAVIVASGTNQVSVGTFTTSALSSLAQLTTKYDIFNSAGQIILNPSFISVINDTQNKVYKILLTPTDNIQVGIYQVRFVATLPDGTQGFLTQFLNVLEARLLGPTSYVENPTNYAVYQGVKVINVPGFRPQSGIPGYKVSIQVFKVEQDQVTLTKMNTVAFLQSFTYSSTDLSSKINIVSTNNAHIGNYQIVVTAYNSIYSSILNDSVSFLLTIKSVNIFPSVPTFTPEGPLLYVIGQPALQVSANLAYTTFPANIQINQFSMARVIGQQSVPLSGAITFSQQGQVGTINIHSTSSSHSGIYDLQLTARLTDGTSNAEARYQVTAVYVNAPTQVFTSPNPNPFNVQVLSPPSEIRVNSFTTTPDIGVIYYRILQKNGLGLGNLPIVFNENTRMITIHATQHTDAGLYQLQLVVITETGSPLYTQYFSVTIYKQIITPSSPLFNVPTPIIYEVYSPTMILQLNPFTSSAEQSQSTLTYEANIFKEGSTQTSYPIVFTGSGLAFSIFSANGAADIGLYTIRIKAILIADGYFNDQTTFQITINPPRIYVPFGQFFLDRVTANVPYIIGSPSETVTITEYTSNAGTSQPLTYTLIEIVNGQETTNLSPVFSFNSQQRKLTISTNNPSHVGNIYNFIIAVSLPDGSVNRKNTFIVNIISTIRPPTEIIANYQDLLIPYTVLSPPRLIRLNPWTSDEGIPIVYSIQQVTVEVNTPIPPFSFDESSLEGLLYSNDNAITAVQNRRFEITARWGNNQFQTKSFTIPTLIKPALVVGNIAPLKFNYRLYSGAQLIKYTEGIKTEPSGLSLNYQLVSSEDLSRASVVYNPNSTPNQFTFSTEAYFKSSAIIIKVSATIVGLVNSGQYANGFTSEITLIPYTINNPAKLLPQYNYMVKGPTLVIPVGDYSTSPAGPILSYSVRAVLSGQNVDSSQFITLFTNPLAIQVSTTSDSYTGVYRVYLKAYVVGDPFTNEVIFTQIAITPYQSTYSIVKPTGSAPTFHMNQFTAAQTWEIGSTFSTQPAGGTFKTIKATLENGSPLPSFIQATEVLVLNSVPPNLSVVATRTSSQDYGTFKIRYTATLPDGVVSNSYVFTVKVDQDLVFVKQTKAIPAIDATYTYNIGRYLQIPIPPYTTLDNGASLSLVTYKLYNADTQQEITSTLPTGAKITLATRNNTLYIDVSQSNYRGTVANPVVDTYRVFIEASIAGYDGRRYHRDVTTSIVIQPPLIPTNKQALRDFLDEFDNSATDDTSARWFCQHLGLNCESVANPYQQIDVVIGKPVTCKFAGICPDGTLKNICAWTSFVAATYLEPGTVTPYSFSTSSYENDFSSIVICSNSLPDHCYYEDQQAPFMSSTPSNGYYACFSTAFNVAPNSIRPSLMLNAPQNLIVQTGNALCQNSLSTASSLITNNLFFKEYINGLPLSNLDQAVGMAFNGVLIFSASAEQSTDILNPIAGGQRAAIDLCMGTSTGSTSVYRYYAFSACIYSSVLNGISDKCANNAQCSANPLAYQQLYTPKAQQVQAPIGVAKDGRIIYNLFTKGGQLWQPCEVDHCNGRYQEDGSYAYVSTMFFPYTVGCWGPGEMIQTTPTCTSSPRKCGVASSGYNLALGVAFIFALFASLA